MSGATRLRGDQVRGIWLPLLLPWDAQFRLDEPALDRNLDRLLESEPHGLYTLDSASEFYALEWAEWKVIAERFVTRCSAQKPRMPIGLGCTWTNQPGAIDRVRAARDLGVETVHLSAPYWLPLDADGLVRFYAAVQREAGDLAIIIYAPPHGKMRLTAELYQRLVREAPNIVGSKTLGDGPELVGCRPGGRPQSHFVHERFLTTRATDGAQGCYSALAGISLGFMKRWWAHIEHGHWALARAYDEQVQRFYDFAIQPLCARGYQAGGIDKALAQIGGAPGARTLRPPYPTLPADLYAGLTESAHALLEWERRVESAAAISV